MENPSASSAITDDQPILNNASRQSRLGFLSLPSEVRLMVYRQEFLRPYVYHGWNNRLTPIPALLATCKLINKEALEVLWGENEQGWNVGAWEFPPTLRPRIVDTIQCLRLLMNTGRVSPTGKIPPSDPGVWKTCTDPGQSLYNICSRPLCQHRPPRSRSTHQLQFPPVHARSRYLPQLPRLWKSNIFSAGGGG